MIMKLSENEIKALKFVSDEEKRNEEIAEIELVLRDIQKRLKELNATLQYGHFGKWYDVSFIYPYDTKYSGGVNEIRIKKNINSFSI